MHRLVQVVLVAAGAALLVGLVRAVGVAEIRDALAHFGVGFLAVVAIELLLDAANTLGWRATFPRGVIVPFWRLYWVRMAGTAVNQLTPTATLGGEVVKAALLRPFVTTTDAVASQIAARMSYAAAQAILVLLGLATILGHLRDSPELATAIVFGFALTFGGVAAFVLWQRRGFFAPLARSAARLGMQGDRWTRLHGAADALDARLATLYVERPGSFAASIGWHLVGQLLSVLQLQFILVWLGTPTSFATCLAIEAFALVLDSATFFVPGRIGVQEGGRVLVFTTLGLRAATGLTVALIVRIAQLIVAALGLAAYGVLAASARVETRPAA